MELTNKTLIITGTLSPAPDMSLENWHTVLNTNLTASFLAARVQIPALIKSGGGALLFTGSVVGYSNAGLPGMSAYSAAKAGLVGLIKSLAWITPRMAFA